MMRHDYHGVQQIAKRFENVMGFAASTDAVTGETFSRMTRCYAGDEKLETDAAKQQMGIHEDDGAADGGQQPGLF